MSQLKKCIYKSNAFEFYNRSKSIKVRDWVVR